jgi:hypothetical protein
MTASTTTSTTSSSTSSFSNSGKQEVAAVAETKPTVTIAPAPVCQICHLFFVVRSSCSPVALFYKLLAQGCPEETVRSSSDRFWSLFVLCHVIIETAIENSIDLFIVCYLIQVCFFCFFVVGIECRWNTENTVDGMFATK